MNKLFSLIIPTYGRPIKLARLLESIDSKSIEIIVVDDNGLGSENQHSTESLISDNRYDINYYCLETNSGASIARNFGVEQASCEIVTFIDDDDLVCVKNLYKKFDYFIRKDCEILCSDGIKNINGNKSRISIESTNPVSFLLKGNCFTPMIMFNKSKLAQPFFLDVPYFQDQSSLLNAFHRGCKVDIFRIITFEHIVHEGERISSSRRCCRGYDVRLDIEKKIIDQYSYKLNLDQKIDQDYIYRTYEMKILSLLIKNGKSEIFLLFLRSFKYLIKSPIFFARLGKLFVMKAIR